MAQSCQNFSGNLPHEIRIGEQENADVVESADDRDILRDIERADSEDKRPGQSGFGSHWNAGVRQKKAVQSEILWGVLREPAGGLPAADTPGHGRKPPELFEEFHTRIVPV